MAQYTLDKMKFNINLIAAVVCTFSCIVNIVRDNLPLSIILAILALINYHIFKTNNNK